MTRRSSILLSAITLLVGTLWLFAASSAQAKMSVGTNLNGVNYYTTEAPFADMMKMSSTWITSTVANQEWESNQEGSIPENSNGWPNYVPFNDSQGRPTYVHTIMPAYANGTYTLTVAGTGQIRVSAPGLSWTTYNVNWSTITFNVSGVDPSSANQSYIYLEIRQSSSNSPIQGIQVWRPGYGDGSRTFYQGFKDKIAPYNTLRFMDWGSTNNSTVVDYWRDGTQKGTYTQGGPNGVALDYMIQLCNETGKNMWLCVPHMASDQYCNAVGYDLTHNLNSNLKVYLEYSNEVWNGQFAQSNWVNNNIADPTGAGYLPRKYGARAAQVFGTFSGQFSAAGRGSQLVRVLAGQAANVWIVQQAMVGANNQCDAIACAPYFGGGITQSQLANGIPSLDTLLSNESYCNMNAVSGWLSAHAQFAASISKPLLCYEGGQHYVGSYSGGNTVDNQALTDQLTALNRSWQMKNLYRYGYNGEPSYLGLVNSNNVSLFMHFTDCGSFSKYGYWGATEYIDQPVGTGSGQAGKAWAIQDWIANG